MKAILAAIFLAGLAAGARAQDRAAPDAAALEAEAVRLRAEIAGLEAEVEQLEESRAGDPSEVELLSVAEAMLEDEERRRAAIALEASLAEELARLDRGASARRDDRDLVIEQVRAVLEQYDILLDETPGEQQRREALAAVARRLDDLAATTPGDGDGAPDREDDLGEALIAAFVLLDAIHADAQRVRLDAMRLHLADGAAAEVDLLRAGLVAHAYRHGDRVGVAVASPADARGFRWTEAVGEEISAAVRESIATVEGGASAIVAVPLDPTGRSREDEDASAHGLIGRFRAGGPVMWPLLLVALSALAITIERAVVLARAGRGSTRAARAVDAFRRGRGDEAAELCRGGGLVCRALEAGIERRAAGPEAMEPAIEARLLHELPRLQRFLPGLTVLAAAAPLLGLLGTVTGIIQTFGVLETFGTARPATLAGGISEALITTAAGLIIAIPILIAAALLDGRVDAVLGEAERRAADLLDAAAGEHDR